KERWRCGLLLVDNASSCDCDAKRVPVALSAAITSTWLIYGAPAAAFVGFYLSRRRQDERQARIIRDEAIEAGLPEPASLHPVIDPAKCVGCATCVRACPEQSVLGVINGKADLIGPTHCIGHGACAAACPVGAIDLVFG